MPEKHLIAPDCLQVRIRFTVMGQTANVIQFAKLGAGQAVNLALANGIMAAIKGQWGANVAALCPAGTLLSGVSIRDCRDIGFAEVDSTVAAQAGSAATELLPRQISATMTLRTAKAGKRYRGRSYLPGFAEGANDATQHFTAAAKTALDTFAAGYTGAFNASGVQLSVLHRPIWDPITGAITVPGSLEVVTQCLFRNDHWTTQRKRAR